MSTSKNEVLHLHVQPTAGYNAAADREANYIGKKIAEGRKSLGYSLDKFVEVLAEYGVHISRTGINKWEVGASSLNAYQLMAVGQALHVHDYGFFMSSSDKDLLNEEGQKKVEEYREDLIATGKYRPQQEDAGVIQYKDMRISNLAVSAGTGQFLDEDNFETVSFPESSIPSGAEFGIRVSGDSMEPVYQDGQIVWVQRCDHLNVGEVGIFVYDGEGYIKMYSEQEPDGKEREYRTDSYGVVHKQPVMVSFNKKYEPREVSSLTSFQIIGRVL